MIDSENKENCCGCGACESICPKQCIIMEPDEEGFVYPVCNHEKCVECGLCRDVCPIINHCSDFISNNEAYAAVNEDSIREQSSSGGAFYAIAQKWIDDGGIVFGARFDEKLVLRHQMAENKDELIPLMGSKYVQSCTDHVYEVVKEKIKAGNNVLFSGTPCQVEALFNYIHGNCENLFLIDVVCHGVASPMEWEKYKSWQSEKHNGAKLIRASFRDKSLGWKNYSMNLQFDDGASYVNCFNKDCFLKAYRKNLCLRPSCYSCKIKGASRRSDITLGDFWGVEKIHPSFNDNKGVTLVIAHTEKGKKLLMATNNSQKIIATDLDQAIANNPSIVKPTTMPKQRYNYILDLFRMSYGQLNTKYCKDRFIVKVKNKVKRYIRLLIHSM